MLCKDCIACREALDQAGITYEFLDFGSELCNLKDFLKIRDASDLFYQAKQDGQIGIPCIVCEDGSITLDWESVL